MKAILVVTVILALLALLIRWLAPHECKAILKKLAGVISELGLLFWIVWCALYAARWRIRDFFRTWFGRTAAGVITLGSFYILLDVTGGVIRHLSVPEIAAEIPELPALNLWLEGLLIALAVLVLRHHMLELRIQKRSAEAPITSRNFSTWSDRC
ncbi:hypothetical protein [Steroidobacter sp.]|uniref:hypothetical protein n=1 Tax=Steroidobacter sp. TaxID=1978227 RepID=UPI001A5D6FF6|nr:hypothetical protein [Steroidobacter sp.]MBL8269063.1 hypothetical protein [Steroidobacter sp.]